MQYIEIKMKKLVTAVIACLCASCSNPGWETPRVHNTQPLAVADIVKGLVDADYPRPGRSYARAAPDGMIVEYFSADGRVFQWRSGARTVTARQWSVERLSGHSDPHLANRVCFGEAVRAPSFGGCQRSLELAILVRSYRDGDVFGLSAKPSADIETDACGLPLEMTRMTDHGGCADGEAR